MLVRQQREAYKYKVSLCWPTKLYTLIANFQVFIGTGIFNGGLAHT